MKHLLSALIFALFALTANIGNADAQTTFHAMDVAPASNSKVYTIRFNFNGYNQYTEPYGQKMWIETVSYAGSSPTQTYSPGFGPYTGDPYPVAIATGSDGKVRLAWRYPNTNKMALWTMNTSLTGVESGYFFYAPADNGFFRDLSMIGNKACLMWATDNGAVVKIINTSGVVE